MKRSAAAILVIAVVALLVLSMSVYTVDQRKAAIKFQLGEVVSMQTEPGLYFMVPVLQNVRLYDTRIQTYDTQDAERFLTSENKNVLVDSFVKWRVIDVRQYYVSVRGDSIAAEARISQTVNDALRAEFAKRTVHDVVSGEREQIMDTVADKVDKDVKSIGVEVVDVRLKRVDLVPEISSDVYRRMESERKRVANELRSTGPRRGREDQGRCRPPAAGDRGRGLPRRPAHQGRGRRAGRAHLRRGLRQATPSSTASTAAWRPTARRCATRAT